LSGRVRLTADVPPGAIAKVKVEDVSRVDAAAVLLAEISLPLPSGALAGTELPFKLVVPVPSNRPSLCVRVHVDSTASGSVTAGDQLSVRAHPALTHGAPDYVVVEVVSV
jgi:hypothetical protein